MTSTTSPEQSQQSYKFSSPTADAILTDPELPNATAGAGSRAVDVGCGLVSFVMIAYNEAPNIARALASVESLDGLFDYELIVVNDGSRDNTAQIVQDFAADNPCVRLINLPENRGRGYARSKGIEAARGELIATVDADIILPRDWFVRARTALNGHDAVGGTAVPDGDVAYLHKAFRLPPRPVKHTTTVTGSNALYRKKVFLMAEFDPSLREGEDSALNHAMKIHSLVFASVPGLQVQHEESKALSASLRWLFEVGKGATRQLIVYRKVRQPDLISAIFYSFLCGGLIFTAFGYPILGGGLPLGFVAAVSVQHVRSKFEIPWRSWPRVAAAVITDAALLTSYFAGRAAGLFSMGAQARHLSEISGPDTGRALPATFTHE
jgi:hypothetical protein